MAHVSYADTARLDLAAAISIIREYFESKELFELAEKHVFNFKAEMRAKEQLLQDNPRLYAVRDDGYFKDVFRQYRSFSVHWFIVFYTYEETDDEVTIWFVRSSKSDYSNTIFLVGK